MWNFQIFSSCLQQLTIVPNKKVLGKEFRRDQKILSESLEVSNLILIFDSCMARGMGFCLFLVASSSPNKPF